MNVLTTDHPMTTKPSGGMQTLTIVFAVIALLLFVGAGFAWHCGWVQEHLCKPVLQKPIRFGDGFSLTSSFSVAYPHYYWVEVVCPRANSSPSQGEDVASVLSRQLPVKFTIICDGVTVAEGDSPGEKSRVCSAAEDTRIITDFKGEPGRCYELSFKTIGANPTLDATQPSLRISSLCSADANLYHMVFSDTTPALIIAGVGLLFAISSCSFLVRRLFRRKQNVA
ncbi:MAG: hypothetical protein ACLQDC_12475 [Verrucomicrobiia bacterium]